MAYSASGGDLDQWLTILLRISLMFIIFRRRNYDKATLCQLSDIIYYLKESAEVTSTMREFLQILTEKKVEIFHSVLRRLVNVKFCSGQMTRINTEIIQRMLRSEKKKIESSLRTVPTIVIAHTFCTSRDTRISYR